MRRLIIALVAAGCITSAGCSNNDRKDATGTDPPKSFRVTMTGKDEAPSAGDPDGSGRATVTVKGPQGARELCVVMTVKAVGDEVLAVHLQEGAKAKPGPILMPLPELKAGKSDGCQSITDELLAKVRKTPESYFVNVRTKEFPGGAIRGQLIAKQ